MNAEEYLKERVEDQIQWLSKKSGLNQSWFKQLRCVEIVLGCAIAPCWSATPTRMCW